MENVRCLRTFISVALYGIITLIATPAIAHHLGTRHHHDDARRQEVADASARRHDRQSHHPRHVHEARTLTRSERLHERREARLAAIAAVHEALVDRANHLHRMRLAAVEAKRMRILAAAEYRAHEERLAANRRVALAEMDGDIDSKSIRVWQAYVSSVPIRLISVDLNDPTVKVKALLARDGIGSAEPFAGMIRRSQPDVAVTGTFFSLDNLRPIGDIVNDGSLEYFGGMGTALCITANNQAQIITVPWGHHHDWSNFDFVMACGPRLLQNGSVWLDPGSERFRDRHMLAPNSRIGVGITSTNKLVFVMTQKPIYLRRLARIMQDEGCVDAMNLDAGTSTGFYCDGNMMARPGRWLTNAIVIYAHQHEMQRSASAISPEALIRTASAN